MMFWIAILGGVLFVWLAVRLGFYETWTLLFNIVVSIYVSVFLTPILAEFAPASGGASSYHTALCLIVLAGGCFALLQGLSFVFLTGQFHIPFPRIFDVVFSGVLGFVAGFLVLSFAALALTTTPWAGHKIVGVLGLSQQSRPANLVCIARSCDLIHFFAGSDTSSDTPQAALERLLPMNTAHPAPRPRPPDANEPPRSGKGE
ncbi:MAG: CvpA family protein [Planctomycetes bacterium]|nr:CvpA family protein [Planctomycetota bacterium]